MPHSRSLSSLECHRADRDLPLRDDLRCDPVRRVHSACTRAARSCRATIISRISRDCFSWGVSSACIAPVGEGESDADVRCGGANFTLDMSGERYDGDSVVAGDSISGERDGSATPSCETGAVTSTRAWGVCSPSGSDVDVGGVVVCDAMGGMDAIRSS